MAGTPENENQRTPDTNMPSAPQAGIPPHEPQATPPQNEDQELIDRNYGRNNNEYMDYIEEAHQELERQKKEVEDEQDPDRQKLLKQTLWKKIVDKIKNKIRPAKGASNSLTDGQNLNENMVVAREAHMSLSQIFDLIRGGGYLNETNISPQNKTVLVKLAEYSHKKGLEIRSATYLNAVVGNLLDENKPDYISFSAANSTQKTEFEDDYDIVKYNDLARNILRQSIIDSATELGITRDELEQRLDIPPSKATAKQHERGGRGFLVPDDPLPAEKQAQMAESFRKIHTISSNVDYNQVQDYLIIGAENAAQRALDRYGTLDPAKDSDFIDSRKFLNPATYEEEIIRILRDELHFTPTEIRDITDKDLVKRYFKSSMTQSEIDNEKEIVDTLLENFSSNEKIKFTLFERSGRKKTIRRADGTMEEVDEIRWSKEGEKQLEKAVNKAIGLLYEKLDKNPGAEYQELFNQLIEGRWLRSIISTLTDLSKNEEILHYIHERGVPGLQGEFRTLIERNFVSKAYIESNQRQLFHVFDEFAKTQDAAKWGGVLARYNLSEFSIFTNEPLIQEMMKQWKDHVQEVVVMNGNVVPGNFNAGEVGGGVTGNESPHQKAYTYRDLIAFRTKMKQHFEDTGEKYEDWEIERAISIARGLVLIDGELPGIMAHTRPPQNFDDLPYAKLLGIRNPRLNWLYGRGGREFIREPHLLMLTVPRKNIDRSITEWLENARKNRWVPEHIIKKGKAYRDYMMDIVEDEKFYEQLSKDLETNFLEGDVSWAQLVNKVSLPGWVDRGGWRLKGVKHIYSLPTDEGGRNKKWGGRNWKDISEWFRKDAGVAMGFITNEERGDEESEAFLMQYLINLDPNDKNVSKEVKKQQTKLIQLFIPGFGKQQNAQIDAELQRLRAQDIWDIYDSVGNSWNGVKREFRYGSAVTTKAFRVQTTVQKLDNYSTDIREEDVNFKDYVEKRRSALYGQSFFHLMQKDPNAFLNNLNQMLPELMKGTYTLSDDYTVNPANPNRPRTMSASQFYFGNDPVPKADAENRKRFQDYVYSRFGRVNKEHVKKIMDFYTDLYGSFGDNTTSQEDKMSLARKALSESLGVAYSKAKKAHRATILAEDICSDEDYAKFINNQLNITNPNQEEKKKALRIRDKALVRQFLMEERLMRNTNTNRDEKLGLIPYFLDHVGRSLGQPADPNNPNQQYIPSDEEKYFGDGAYNLGRQNGFFTTIGNTWLYKDIVTSTPNGDINHNILFHRAAASGENGITRAVSENELVEKSQEIVRNWYSTLKKISLDGDMKHALELQKELKKLDDIFGREYMNELQYNLAFLTIRYMQEDWHARIPFGMGKALELYYGESVSMSKSKFLVSHGKTWNSDDIRTYIRELRIDSAIAPKGPFSELDLRAAVGVSNTKYFATEVIPNAGSYFILLLIYSYIKKALEEQEGKK